MNARKLRVVVFDSDGEPASGVRIRITPYDREYYKAESGFVRLSSILGETDEDGVASLSVLPSALLGDLTYEIDIMGFETWYFEMPDRDVNLHELALRDGPDDDDLPF